MKFTMVRITRTTNEHGKDEYRSLIMLGHQAEVRVFANGKELFRIVDSILLSKGKTGIEEVHKRIDNGAYEFFGDLLDLTAEQAALFGWNRKK